MRFLVRFLLMLVLIMGVWIGIGLGLGFVLHGLVPAIDVGMGTLIGVVTLGLRLQWLSRVSTLSALYGEEEAEVPDATWPTMPQREPRASHRQRRRRRSENPTGCMPLVLFISDSSTHVYEFSGKTGSDGQDSHPELYMVGISEASQHLARCSGAKVIVAINKDAETTIFHEVRYGVMGD